MNTQPAKRALEAKIWTLLEPAVIGAGFEIVEIELVVDQGRNVLRLYVDRPYGSAAEGSEEGGITLGDTTQISHLVNPLLDLEDPIEGSYQLEVSSPGLDRPLRKAAHFQRFAGSRVKVRTDREVSDSLGVLAEKRHNFSGVLQGYHDGVVAVDVEGRVFELPHDSIVRARLDTRYDQESNR